MPYRCDEFQSILGCDCSGCCDTPLDVRCVDRSWPANLPTKFPRAHVQQIVHDAAIVLCVRPRIEAQRRRHHQQIIRSVSVPFFRHIAVAAHQREFSHCSVYAAMGKQNKLVHTFSDAHLGWCLHCKYGSILDLCRRQVACVTPGGPCFSSQSRTSSCTRGEQQSQKTRRRSAASDTMRAKHGAAQLPEELS